MSAPDQLRHRIDVTGVVQGVGFRPFVARLAHDQRLRGWVRNTADGVRIEVQGSSRSLDRFHLDLVNQAPPLAQIEETSLTEIEPRGAADFRIEPSSSSAKGRANIPADTATCDACLSEMFDPADRRFRHGFITCTDCGPRWTIATGLPYDRPRTTMGDFPMCPACSDEYHDLSGRRHHAQPIACPECGPRLRWSAANGDASMTATAINATSDDQAIAATQTDLAAGKIVALKGIGGFHLVVDASNDAAVERLRRKKHRAEKPFAIMVKDLAAARDLAEISPEEQRALTSPARPIVLLRVRDRACGQISQRIAPGSSLIGIMLPYSPLHHLLLRPVPGHGTKPSQALVMTSGNLAGEPIVHDDHKAITRLSAIADSFCMHDRAIATPCDDSVVRIIDGHESPIRRSRGYAPVSISLPFAVPPLLAVGADLKNTCCVASGHRALVSQHLGDMGSLASQSALQLAVDGISTLHAITPTAVVADRHPEYRTRGLAARYQLPLHLVGHHHAHLAAVLAEHHVDPATRVIGCLFDGTGWGDDDTLWGGEMLVGGYERVDRAGHLRSTRLPGGDAAVRNPWRMALAHLAEAQVDPAGLACRAQATAQELDIVDHQITTGFASPRTTSMGRLFDAAASLLDVRHVIHYEAQAAIELEALAASAEVLADGLAFGLATNPTTGVATIDPRPLIRSLVEQVRSGVDAASLALGFHHAVAAAVALQATDMRAVDPELTMVALSGGVFQNHLMTTLTRARLEADGFRVLTHRRVPANDGGLSLGQAAVAGFRMSQLEEEAGHG